MRTRARSAGMVTAELAVAIPTVVIVLALSLGGVSAGIDQIRCVDAARLGARALARGDDPGAVRSVAARAAPGGSSVVLGGGSAEVQVSVTVHRGLFGWGSGFDIHATSVAPREELP